MKYLLLLLLIGCSKDYEYCKFNNREIKYEPIEWTMGTVKPIVYQDTFFSKTQNK